MKSEKFFLYLSLLISFTSCIKFQNIAPTASFPLKTDSISIQKAPQLYFDESPHILFQEVLGDSVALISQNLSSRKIAFLDQAALSERFVNWADFPSFHFMHNGTWISHTLEKVPGSPYAYHIKVFGNGILPRKLHDDDSASEHGFVSYASNMSSTVAVWLDGRNTASGESHDDEHHGGGGSMQLMARMYTTDWQEERLLDNRVCDCCQTSVIINDHGDYVVFYRNRSEGEIRDITRIVFDGESESEPMILGDDNWVIPGCPVNGPSAASLEEEVLVAWFTGADEKSSVKYAVSANLGYDFEDAITLSSEANGRCQVLTTEEGFLILWMEYSGEEKSNIIASYVIAGSEMIRTTLSEVSSSRRTGFPKAMIANDQLFLSYVDYNTNGILVETFPMEPILKGL